MAPRVTVIVNPAAKGGRVRALLPELRRHIDQSGIDYHIAVSPAPDAPADLAREALSDGRTVIAAGGDGLIGAVAGPVVDCGGTLGIVPLGSGNDLARDLGYDLSAPFEAISAIESGRTLNMDVGRANGHVFCTVAGTGFDAMAAAWARSVSYLSGNPLYVAAVLRTLARFRPRQVHIDVDGRTLDVPVAFVAIGNTRYYGGGMQIAPRADYQDGLLNVVIAGKIGRIGLLRAFPKVYSGRHLDLDVVTSIQGRRILIEQRDRGPKLPWMADGELYGTLPLELTVNNETLRVIVPNSAKLA